MVSWRGWYRDRRGSEPITIENDGEMLSVRIRGVDFVGRDFDGLEPATGGRDLCSCTLAWVIPVGAELDGEAVDGVLECELRLGDPRPQPRGGIDAEDLTMVLAIGGRRYATTKPHENFEEALVDIHQQLPPKQYIRACVTCAWSDYNPAGNPLFGGLACFRGNKDAYRRVNDKRELFRVWPTLTEFVQETHVCGEFERRGVDAGYRGTIGRY